MAPVTVQGIWVFVRKMAMDMVLRPIGKQKGQAAVAVVLAALLFVCLFVAGSPVRNVYAQEKDTILSDSGILYPGGYDLNTAGYIQGKVKGLVIPESGPVRMTLIADRETYVVLASPGWFWEDQNIIIPEGTDVKVYGSKSLGNDSNLYIIAREIEIISSNQKLVFRNDQGEPIWSSSQRGRTGMRGGGFGSPSRGRIGGGPSGMGRGRR